MSAFVELVAESNARIMGANLEGPSGCYSNPIRKAMLNTPKTLRRVIQMLTKLGFSKETMSAIVLKAATQFRCEFSNADIEHASLSLQYMSTCFM